MTNGTEEREEGHVICDVGVGQARPNQDTAGFGKPVLWALRNVDLGCRKEACMGDTAEAPAA